MQRLHHPTPETKSAARLAAEAAFAPARPTTPQPFDADSPAITVLRAKRVAILPDRTDAAAASLGDPNASTQPRQPALKVPRVFLLKSAPFDPGSTASGLPPLLDAQAAEAPAVRSDGAAASTPVRRARRRQNKARPVTLIFAASSLAAPSVPRSASTDAARLPGVGNAALPTQEQAQLHTQTQTETQPQPQPQPQPHTHTRTLAHTHTQTQEDASAPRSAGLSAALAELGPTFAAIHSAIGFTVADPQCCAQWHSLSRALDHIAAEIRNASAQVLGRGWAVDDFGMKSG